VRTRVLLHALAPLGALAAPLAAGCGTIASPNYGQPLDGGRDGATPPPWDGAQRYEAGAPFDAGLIAPPGDDAGSTAGDAGGTAQSPGLPFDVSADEQWTWVDVPGARCGNGSPTGIGVNFTPHSDQLLIFLEGGGACWDADSCWGIIPEATNLNTGYDRAAWDTDLQRVLLPMQRGDATNPFRAMQMAYVPYCTGDVHSGDNVVTYTYFGIDHPTYFVGGRNLAIYLARLAATFPDVRHVWIAGDSAGGFGAAFNLGRVREAFPRARVDVLDDSGQPIQPDPARWRLWRAAWNLHMPADCAWCGDQVSDLVEYYLTRYRDSRFGLISYTHDAVISTFMNLSSSLFNQELMQAADQVDHGWPNAHYFLIDGSLHVGLLGASPALVTWLQQMVNDDPAWTSVRP
jgi:hypothetical protein